MVKAKANSSADSSQRIALLAMFELEPLPLVNIKPRSLAGEAVVPCANLINGSVTVVFVVSIVVVVPETVRFPDTVRLSVIATLPSVTYIALAPSVPMITSFSSEASHNIWSPLVAE